MTPTKKALVPQAVKSVTAGVTNAPQYQRVFKHCDVDCEQWQIADIQAGLREADLGEFASAEEVRAVFAKYSRFPLTALRKQR